MKEINEIREFLNVQMLTLQAHQAMMLTVNNSEKIEEYQKQLDNANKLSAKLQGAIDLFKDIEEL